MTPSTCLPRFLRAGFAAALLFAAPAAAADDESRALAFFAGQGCAIGPSTQQAAVEAGHAAQAVSALAERAGQNPEAAAGGGWLVLPPGLCTIRPPTITSQLKLTDPEVRKSFSAPDAYAEEGEPGCFLNTDILFSELRQTRGWDDEAINREYVRMLGAGLVAGDLAFYTDSPLRTPPGFQLLAGTCGAVPDREAIRESHGFLVASFDALVRRNAVHVPCRYGESPMSLELPGIAGRLSEGRDVNPWLGLELLMIALGGGWYEGASMTERGMPRPPICRYE